MCVFLVFYELSRETQSAPPTDIQDEEHQQFSAEQIAFKSHVIASLQSKSSKNASGAQNTMGEAHKKKHSGFMSYGHEKLWV